MTIIHAAAPTSAIPAARDAERDTPPCERGTAPREAAREPADDPGAIEYASWLRWLGALAG